MMTEDHRVTSYAERQRINETGVQLKDGDTRLCGTFFFKKNFFLLVSDDTSDSRLWKLIFGIPGGWLPEQSLK